ncbi:hypothetical protein RHGRI_006702 [Rhododendron griersonianum]|uniref:ZF-HD dimerization-type domain-containing protein n=1 Tax=Rhododendron griersonianum TaxID=479676 RepID=A0AAV6KU64_9ERIC|nr:hypothetical protein RHGRI_006702 [Rhododendron griersonianum]
MTTTSAAKSTSKFNKRLRTATSRSAFVSPADCDDDRELDPMKQLTKEEIKEVLVGTNGVLKEKTMGVRYKECRKNHAASIGGHAVDGCREFMPAGEEGTAAAFKCAACSCHRNFHRQEAESNDCYCDCSAISATTK